MIGRAIQSGLSIKNYNERKNAMGTKIIVKFEEKILELDASVENIDAFHHLLTGSIKSSIDFEITPNNLFVESDDMTFNTVKFHKITKKNKSITLEVIACLSP